jgi:hypothetical protein
VKLYAASCLAQQQTRTGIETNVRTVAFMANNENEAMGMALRHCMEIYPNRNGYMNHIAPVLEIPNNLIETYLNEMITRTSRLR